MSLFDILWRDTLSVRPLIEKSGTGTPVYGESRDIRCRLCQRVSGETVKTGDKVNCAYRLLTSEPLTVGDLVATAGESYPVKKVTRYCDAFGSAAYWEAAL